jgi:hypothetical protein
MVDGDKKGVLSICQQPGKSLQKEQIRSVVKVLLICNYVVSVQREVPLAKIASQLEWPKAPSTDDGHI